jgi:alcohol dehydrogenase (cytochrome c)
VAAVVVAGAVFANWDKAVPLLAMGINYVRYLSAPAGTLTTELAGAAAAYTPTPASGPSSEPDQTPGATADDWPSYNKTLTSNRFSELTQINRSNVGGLRVLCTYDTGQYTGFTSGLLEVNGALIAVTEYDIFSIDPSSCRLNWRTHEDYTPASPQGVNRGAAYMNGELFRGTQDGSWPTTSRLGNECGRPP